MYNSRHIPHLFTVIVIAVLAISCSEHSADRLLASADSLMNTRPDSAMTMLDNYSAQASKLPESQFWFYHLLCLKARDKQYIRHTSDSTIMSILDYYNRHTSDPHYPEALYYAGRVYSDLGDAPQATGYYQKALDCVDSEKDNGELESRICAQLARTFLYQHIYNEALEYSNRYYKYAVDVKDTATMIYAIYDIAQLYDRIESHEKALQINAQGMKLAQKFGKPNLYGEMLIQKSSILSELNDYEQALAIIDEALSNVRSEDVSAAYSAKARILYLLGQNDSAEWYMTQLTEKGLGNIYAQKKSYCNLANISSKKGDAKAACEFVQKFLEAADSVDAITEKETVRQMNALYNYQLRERENQQLKSSNSNARIVIVLLVAIVFITVAFFIVYHKVRQHQNRLKMAVLTRIKEQQERMSAQTQERLVAEIETLKNRVETTEDEKLQLNKQLADKEAHLVRFSQMLMVEKDEQSSRQKMVADSEIYRTLTDKLHVGTFATETEIHELAQCINNAYPSFSTTLNSLCNLSPTEWAVCLMTKAEFAPSKIAKLLARENATVTMCKKRLYLKIFDKQGTAKELDDFILSL